MNIDIKKNISDFKIDYTMTDLDQDLTQALDLRETVRGICLKGSKILVVYTKNDQIYGTPGGGVEGKEDKKEALKRELIEEVGAKQVKVLEYLGKVSEKRMAKYPHIVFNPIQNYYLVEINEFGKQQLIEYEKVIDLQYDFIDINEVIKSNEVKLNQVDNRVSGFYHFQTKLFKIIKELYNL